MTATKVASKGHGYEKTLQGIDASLQRMKFGAQNQTWSYSKFLTHLIFIYYFHDLEYEQTTSTFSWYTTPSLENNVVWRRTKRCSRLKQLGRSSPLGCPICGFWNVDSIFSLQTNASAQCSNVKHIEEIKQAGFEIPSVNQIEVSSIVY